MKYIPIYEMCAPAKIVILAHSYFLFRRSARFLGRRNQNTQRELKKNVHDSHGNGLSGMIRVRLSIVVVHIIILV